MEKLGTCAHRCPHRLTDARICCKGNLTGGFDPMPDSCMFPRFPCQGGHNFLIFWQHYCPQEVNVADSGQEKNMKIAYSAVIKNPRRKTAPYYGRVRQDGRERLVPLHTQDPVVARKWVERQQHVLFEVNEYLDSGQQVPGELMAKLITVDTAPFAQEVAKEPVSVPGGILERWEVDMRVHAFSEVTIRNYLKAARIVIGELPIASLTVEKVKDLISAKVKLSNNTRRFYCNALRHLFRFIGREDLANALPRIKPVEGDHVYWSYEQMYDIACTVQSDTPERTEQYRLYFLTLLESGARNSELREIRWKDLDNAMIRFSAGNTKMRRTRTVPISWKLYAELDVIRKEPDEYVFNLVSKNPTRRYKILQRACKRLGIPKSGLHCYRRSRATEIYRRCGIKVAAQMLGDSETVALKTYIEEVGVEQIRREVYGEG